MPQGVHVGGGARRISRAFLCQEQTLPLFRLLTTVVFFLFLSFLSSNGREHAVRAEDICDPFCSRDLCIPIHPPRTLFGFPFLFSSCVPVYGTQRICVSFPLYTTAACCFLNDHLCQRHISWSFAISGFETRLVTAAVISSAAGYMEAQRRPCVGSVPWKNVFSFFFFLTCV